MLLSEAAALIEIEVRRDGEFRNLGFPGHTLPAMLLFLEHEKHVSGVCGAGSAAAVLTTGELAGRVDGRLALGVCEEPRMAFARLHNILAARGFYWEDFESEIHPEARVHPRAWVAPRNVRIGARTVVEPNATILERCLLDEDVHVGAGAVLGGQGFQTVRTGPQLVEMEHGGGVQVRRGVRIFPGAVVAAGLFRENTLLGEDARIGSQAFVSHGASVGERAFVGHGAVVNGRVEIGRDAWIGPGATLAQKLKVGERAVVSLGAVLIGDVPDGARVSGNFAIPHRKLLRHLAAVESAGQ